MMNNYKAEEREEFVIKFSGDSGDGMQLTGTLFSNLSAILGNEISTFPDFPSEIRAPQGTLGGVSGFQMHIGSCRIHTPGEGADVLVVMNPAALKVNVGSIKKTSVIIFDVDSFEKSDLEKAGFTTDNPFAELNIPDTVQLVPTPLTFMTKESLKDFDLDNKSKERCKNMFALGLICFLFDRPVDQAIHFLENKFKKKPAILEANAKVLVDGFNYGQNTDTTISQVTHIHVTKSHCIEKGKYTLISGNKATAWGLIAAAHKAGLQLFLGSYPITPATDILHELSERKDMGVITVQAEDEIAGICTAIGASFAGNLAATSTSGPGLALKSEAIGLAVMAELPLVVIDVMRSGPSTGMPTKTEQTDLLQALYGRNGESPVVVLAASTPADCYRMAYAAAKIALEHMTPVILLTDAFIGNGSSLWKLPTLAEMPEIKLNCVKPEMAGMAKVTTRDEESNVRYWSVPGMKGFEHHNGGLEKDYDKGSISTDPKNHQKMTDIRQAKIEYIANFIPDLEVKGCADADLLVVGWGGTHGHLITAVNALNRAGNKVAMAHFNYIYPLPKNTEEVFKKYKKIIVCELNGKQFALHLRSRFSHIQFETFNKIEGQPFVISELKKKFLEML